MKRKIHFPSVELIILLVLTISYGILIVNLINHISNLENRMNKYENKTKKIEIFEKMYNEDLQQLEEYNLNNATQLIF